MADFSGSSGFLIMGKQNYFFTDFRYREIAEKLAKNGARLQFQFIELDKRTPEILKKIIGSSKTIAFESEHMTVEELSRWKKRLKGVKFTPLMDTIEELRKYKDDEEIAKLKKSQQINEDTLARVKKLLKPGITELEVAWKIKIIGHDSGAEDISFEPIVAFQENSSTPHHQNTNRKLRKNELVLIDMGMKYKEYCSDMTRTFFFGKGAKEQLAIYDLVLNAQMAGIKAIRHGVKASTPDTAARKIMGKYEKFFGHSLGHGIGLDVHESPSLSSNSKDVLKENMIVTVEPGIYLKGKFGVRIEDMGRVTKTGYENFTKAPK
ncbi:aminopeptidase P family protein [Candidatus Peregrinibacteria bacterium]|nr:aminopeptidase P family protein [Candidatus Peregrinibacteria bacterium]